MGNFCDLVMLTREAYLRCLQHTPGWTRAVKTGTVARYRLAATDRILTEYIAWVREIGLSDRLAPVAWVYSMFEARGYRYSLSVDRLQARGHLPSFQSMSWKHYRQAGDLELSLTAVDGCDGVALDEHGADTARSRYVSEGQEELCMLSWRSITRGYHPASKVCCRCRLASTCEHELGKYAPGLVSARRAWAANGPA